MVFDIGEELEQLAAVLSVTQDLKAATIALTVDAVSWDEALATTRVGNTVGRASLTVYGIIED